MFEIIKEFMCNHEWVFKDQLIHYKENRLVGYTFICYKCAKVKKQMI